MSGKQAKRIRRAMRELIAIEKPSMAPGPKAEDMAAQLGEQLHMLWGRLNHRQRGAVSACLPCNLPRAARLAIGFAIA